MPPIIGIDIANDTFDVCLIRDDLSPEIAQFNNSNTGFQIFYGFLRKQGVLDAHVCMEATGRYYEALADFLLEKCIAVSVVNPVRVKGYAHSRLQRNKTDRLDAALIADFCRTQRPDLWQPPSPHQRTLQALVRHLDDLEQDRQRQRNRRHALQKSNTPADFIIENLNAQIAFLTAQIERVKQQISSFIDRHPDLKHQCDLIASIPGIGQLTAAKLIAEFRDLTAFDHPKQLVAFAGLNPRHRQSGTSVHGRSGISKMGRASLRAALYMPAISAKTHNPTLRTFADRLLQRGKSPKEIVVAVMRKLLHLVFGVLKHQQPFNPNYRTNLQAAA